MRLAITYSLALHILVGVLSMATVKFRAVRFIPRDVYSVQLIDLSQMPKPVVEQQQQPPPQEEPPPPEPEPEIKEEPPDEMVPPPERKKPKKPKRTAKTVEPEKIKQPPEPQPQIEEPTEQPPGETGDLQLSVDDFPFAYYVSSMKRKIASYWNVPESADEVIHCVVYFRVRRNGTLESVAVETGSGSFLFDQAALRAVTRAGPLPPLPDGFKDNYLGVHFTFAYEKER